MIPSKPEHVSKQLSEPCLGNQGIINPNRHLWLHCLVGNRHTVGEAEMPEKNVGRFLQASKCSHCFFSGQEI